MNKSIAISCEHGGHKVPQQLLGSLKIPSKVLNSHRGYDKGALSIAKILSKKLSAFLITNEQSRLVIDFNRSLHHPLVWSSYSRELSQLQKNKLIMQYLAYRKKLLLALTTRPLHLSIHSFTPILNGEKRNCEVGILFDPAHKKEQRLANQIKRSLIERGIKCRLNYPYLGKADGLTTHYRKQLGKKYSGLEIEFNQSIVDDKIKVKKVVEVLIDSLRENHLST